MTAWEYYSEWWSVDFSKKGWSYTPPPMAQSLGSQGWELVSVTCVPWTGSKTGPQMGEDFHAQVLKEVFTSGVTYQAFYKRPVSGG